MMRSDVGVLPDSIRFYHDADAFTAAHLYHIPHAGIYRCDRRYEVQRDRLDVCQVMLVDAGELAVEYRGQQRTAGPGTLVLLDCREPHRYRARTDELRMRWFHLLGSSSAAYTALITQTHGVVLPVLHDRTVAGCCRTIMDAVRQGQPEPHTLSLEIGRLLVSLMLLLGEPEQGPVERAIRQAADYIEAHYAEHDLSVDALARRAALSPCYFMRQFKLYQGTTPHRFLQAVRLRAAKEQLMTTAQSVEEIAYACGFCSSSHLIAVFRRDTGLTPYQFRVRWQ